MWLVQRTPEYWVIGLDIDHSFVVTYCKARIALEDEQDLLRPADRERGDEHPPAPLDEPEEAEEEGEE